MGHELRRSDFYRKGYATMADLRRLLDTIAEHFSDRSQRNLTIVVVAELSDLPADASSTEWFRVVATPAVVYIGNGPGRPLSRFNTTPVCGGR